MNKLIAITLLAALAGIAGADTMGWINEFHYDNDSTDVGEFIEVALLSSITNLSDYKVSLYNGSDDELYGSNDEFTLDMFTAGDTVNGYTLYWYNLTDNGASLQNGSPDGLALTKNGDVSVDLEWDVLSYEGSMGVLGDGEAAGATPVDVGVSEPSSAPIGSSLGLTDETLPGTWTYFEGTATPGSVNVGQTIVPEPATLGLLAAGGLMMLRRRR